MKSEPVSGRYGVGLMLGALGVVYGDIGTSPLYALRECFAGSHGIMPTHDNVLGVLSLIFWSLLIIVSVKYLAVVLRATNKGEGGILSLMALAFPDRSGDSGGKRRAALLAMGVFGAALLYGDGMITPAISVLSAVEGINVVTPMFDHYVLPITVIVLVALFAVQHHGTGKVGSFFGPVMVAWFAVIAALGIKGILLAPEVWKAVDPLHGAKFLVANGWTGFVVLGAVFLVVTGAEALYADVGHFGPRPIRIAWFAMVLPALFLNYLGQGALLLSDPGAVANPFYLLAPKWGLIPLVVLATSATVIASQALISGAYSLTMQAVQLGYLPRMEIRHTSRAARGQIYLPHLNWFLMFSCIGLVLGFRSSTNLAAAYGIAVTLTMLTTTLLFYVAARRLWNWSAWQAGAVCAVFVAVELAFFAANFLKVLHGGWFPLVVATMLFTAMTTWKKGRSLVRAKLVAASMPLDLFLADVEANSPRRVAGSAIFMAGNPNGTPIALLHNLKHNKVLHERNLLLTLVTDDVPQVDAARRVEVEELTAGFRRIVGHYGFMEEPNVPELLATVLVDGKAIDLNNTTFFLSRETIIPTDEPGMMKWREKLFAFMSRNAQSATQFFDLPANRVVELGMQVEI
ncbi:MAG: potassium transporter Kup [Verrucomicrobia bacterium]|nr:potassium transporter Kup [Verrucomicrobiota bacterium]